MARLCLFLDRLGRQGVVGTRPRLSLHAFLPRKVDGVQVLDVLLEGDLLLHR